jgi:hypothetical protein
VESPSEWKQSAQRAKGELSEREELREEFWTAFRDRIRARRTSLSVRKPGTRHYYSNPIGVGGYHISYWVNEDEHELGLELTIEDGEAAYRELREQTDEIEDELGHEVYWNELRETRGGNMRSNIGVTREANIEDRERWDEYFEWMFDVGERFHEVFPDRLRRLE